MAISATNNLFYDSIYPTALGMVRGIYRSNEKRNVDTENFS
jgi:hypothetical protein